MADGGFGHLVMPTAPQAAETVVLWSDIAVNRIAVTASLILLLFLFKDIVDFLPTINECLSVKHGHVHLEHNRSKARTRNHLASFLSFPFVILASRFGLFTPGFFSLVSESLSLPMLYGMFLVYAALRGVLYTVVPMPLSREDKTASGNVPYTYLIPLSLLILLTGGILAFFGAEENTARVFLYAETGLAFFVSLVKTGQIFADKCGVFSTFLYLCGLEIVPAGVLVACSILL